MGCKICVCFSEANKYSQSVSQSTPNLANDHSVTMPLESGTETRFSFLLFPVLSELDERNWTSIVCIVRIGSTAVQPVSTVRDLGIMLDAEVTMSTHVSAVVKASFAALRRIRSVRRSIPRRALLALIRALVVSKVDCCNSVRAGVSDTLLRRLQSVLNAAARPESQNTSLRYSVNSIGWEFQRG